jgi:oxygen-independent coproporphyrinogen-3 oxidase
MSKIAALFSTNVPRYTSYPTAPHFHAGIDGARYAEWLAALPQDMPLSLYLHIPFCDTLCWFCGCHTSVVNNYAPVRDYCDLLRAETR